MLAGLNELRYEGYEIHMGRSEAQMPALAGNGNVYGSYVCMGYLTRRASRMRS